jgi:serine/threonine protein kinase
MTEPEHRHANGAAQLFQDEVQVLATLDHPNITRCVAFHGYSSACERNT